MKESKISLNIILVIVIFASAVTFFITVKMTDVASIRWAHNSFNYIDDSEYAVRYSNLEANGIYRGTGNNNTLVAEGNFGYGENAAINGSVLYTNEYDITKLGLEMCNVVRLDLETGEKTVLFTDAYLTGRCRSGEIVITDGYAVSRNNPSTNALCRFYALSGSINLRAKPSVIFYDMQKENVAYKTDNKAANEKLFNKTYIDKTLQEVRG